MSLGYHDQINSWKDVIKIISDEKTLERDMFVFVVGRIIHVHVCWWPSIAEYQGIYKHNDIKSRVWFIYGTSTCRAEWKNLESPVFHTPYLWSLYTAMYQRMAQVRTW